MALKSPGRNHGRHHTRRDRITSEAATRPPKPENDPRRKEPLSSLGLVERVLKPLLAVLGDEATVGDLVDLTELDVRDVPGIGPKSYMAIAASLPKGMTFRRA